MAAPFPASIYCPRCDDRIEAMAELNAARDAALKELQA